MNNQATKSINILEYILLFLGFLNFTGRVTYLLLAFAGIYIAFRIRSIRFNMNTGTVIYLAFFAAYLAATLLFSELRDIMAPVCGLLMFFVGQAVALKEDRAECKRLAFVAITGLTVHGILNFVINIVDVEKLALREVEDIWLGTQQATGHMNVFIPLIAGSFVILFLTKSHWANRVFGILCLVISVVYTFLCATRYVAYLFVIVSVSGLILYLIEEKDPEKRKRMLKIFGIVILLLAIIFALDIFGVRTAFLTSNLVTRIEEFHVDSALTSVDRSEQMQEVVSHFETYLLGGMPTGLPFVHNSWLSNLNFGGLFLFLTFTAVTLRLIYILFLCKRRMDFLSFAYLVGFVICILGYCWIESIFDTSRPLFYLMSMMLGIMEGVAARSPVENSVDPDADEPVDSEEEEAVL